MFLPGAAAPHPGRLSGEQPSQPRPAPPHLHKGVDSHDGHVGLTLGIVHQVEIHQLLQFQIVRLHTVHYIWKERTEEREREGELILVPRCWIRTQRKSLNLKSNLMRGRMQ